MILKIKLLFILIIFSFSVAALDENFYKRYLTPLNKNIQRGHAKKIEFKWPLTWSEPSISCLGKKILIGVKEKKIDHLVYYGFVSISYNTKIKKFNCQLLSQDHHGKKISQTFLRFSLVPFKAKIQILNVPKKMVDLSSKDLKRYQKEKKRLQQIFSHPDIKRKFVLGQFQLPLNSVVTSPYGWKRIFNDKKNSWHKGVDFRAAVGTLIPSGLAGKVVLAQDLFFNGKTVIIDHGQSVYTLYCHLSEIKVKEGQEIGQGATIGLSGNTGRSNGPHLHWGVKVMDHWVDGVSFIAETQMSGS